MKAQLSRFPHDLALGAEFFDCLSSTPASADFQAGITVPRQAPPGVKSTLHELAGHRSTLSRKTARLGVNSLTRCSEKAGQKTRI